MKEGIHADAFKRSFFQDGIAVIDLADLLLEKTDNDNKNDDDNSQNNNNNNSNNNSQHTIAGPIFDQFRAALPRLRSDVSLHIPPDATEAHSVTGFHPAGTHPWSARSNLYREGIVVSNHHHGANLPDKWLQPHGLDLLPLVQLLHRVANHVLQIIEKQLELPPGWFDEHLMGGGGATLQSTSQFHLKSYVWPQQPGEHDGDTPTQQSVSSARKQNDALEPPTLLPSHTDPSLISVVLLDRPGHQPGSQGLEYCTANGQWKETSHSGHDSAIVLVGGALSYMTGGYLPAPRHRVKCHSRVGHEELHQHRCAATLFVRPPGSVILCVPPSPTLTYVQLKRNWTFAEWNARVSKNYRKSKPPKPQSQRDDRSKSPTHEGGVVFRDECTELALWPCPVVGREKFLGGELSTRNGKIYTIPGHAPRVMVIDAPRLEQYATPCDNDPVPSHHCNGSSSLSDMMYCIGPEFDGEYKWLRGVSMPNGLIVGIPCHAGAILCINPDTDRVFTVDWDETDPLAPSKDLPWKWHGGQVSPFDGCLYCIPQRAETVLKFDPTTLTATFLGGPFPGRNKWYGGLLGCDGAIYGVNQNHPSVLRIDPNNQITTLHGHFPDGGHKWHGGVLGPDGNIYGIPANADCVLKIEPGPIPRITTIGGPLRSGQHRTDGKYKYLGGAVGVDGNVHFFPSDSDHVLQIDIATGECREVGPDLRGVEAMQQNKWQNGFTSGDFLYGIPLKGNSVIRMRLRDDGQDPDVTTVGGPFLGLNKWEGGVMSAGGVMYCVPLNHSHVLQIRPLS